VAHFPAGKTSKEPGNAEVESIMAENLVFKYIGRRERLVAKFVSENNTKMD